MVEHHRSTGDGACQFQVLPVLIVVVPRVVAESALPQPGDARPECGVGVQTGRCAARDHEHLGVFGAGPGVADAAQSAARRLEMRIEHVVQARVRQVGVRDDATHHGPRRSLRLRGHELGLADGGEPLVPAGAVPRSALHEDRVDHVVPVTDVREQLVEAVRQRTTLGPQMVVRIDDRRVRIDDVLDDRIEPFLAPWKRRGVTHLDEPSQAPIRRSQPEDPGEPTTATFGRQGRSGVVQCRNTWCRCRSEVPLATSR